MCLKRICLRIFPTVRRSQLLFVPGDFAVLLRAGMSVKKALFFNIISSALCFLGVVCGVLVGNIGGMNSWVFAFTAGIFVYLSLVDMVSHCVCSCVCVLCVCMYVCMYV